MSRQRHNGRGMPVNPESLVRVWIRADPGCRALEQVPIAAKRWVNWSHNGGPGDIMFFEQMGEVAA